MDAEIAADTTSGATTATTQGSTTQTTQTTLAARRAANRRKVRQHRQRLRAQGMRPIQIWVPDVHAPEFAAEARRQCLLANASEDEADIQALIDAVDDWPEDAYSP